MKSISIFSLIMLTTIACGCTLDVPAESWFAASKACRGATMIYVNVDAVRELNIHCDSGDTNGEFVVTIEY